MNAHNFFKMIIPLLVIVLGTACKRAPSSSSDDEHKDDVALGTDMESTERESAAVKDDDSTVGEGSGSTDDGTAHVNNPLEPESASSGDSDSDADLDGDPVESGDPDDDDNGNPDSHADIEDNECTGLGEPSCYSNEACLPIVMEEPILDEGCYYPQGDFIACQLRDANNANVYGYVVESDADDAICFRVNTDTPPDGYQSVSGDDPRCLEEASYCGDDDTNNNDWPCEGLNESDCEDAAKCVGIKAWYPNYEASCYYAEREYIGCTSTEAAGDEDVESYTVDPNDPDEICYCISQNIAPQGWTIVSNDDPRCMTNLAFCE